MEKMLAFRLDDIAPGLKRDNLNRLETIFDKYGIKPMLGVVPCNEDDHLKTEECDEQEFWDNVRRLQEKGWPVAQHGYRHMYCTEDSGLLNANPFSEFAGVAGDIQMDIIANGKSVLQDKGLNTECFMAPGHTFDENTLSALKASGFKYITDGYSKELYEREGIIFIPCTLADPKEPQGVDTVCIHLNNWNDSDFEALEKFLDKSNDLCANFDRITSECKVIPYGERIKKQEDDFRKLKERKQKAADSAVMQRYLQKSYSENKYVKLIKRVLFLPMLLKK